MNQALLNAHLRYQLHRHGWLAAAGLLLLLASLGLQWLLVEPLHASNEVLRSELSAQRRKQVQKPDLQVDAGQRQAAFYATLPDSSDTLHAVAVLQALRAPAICAPAIVLIALQPIDRHAHLEPQFFLIGDVRLMDEVHVTHRNSL